MPNGHATSSTTSRSSVSTSSVEKAPSASMPAQLKRSAVALSRERRPKNASGIRIAEASSSATNAHGAAEPGSSGAMRQPMYRCSSAESHRANIARR